MTMGFLCVGAKEICAVFRGSSMSIFVDHMNLMSVTTDVWMVNGLVTGCGLRTCIDIRGMDIWGAKAVLPPTSEFVWSNNHVCDSVTDHLCSAPAKQCNTPRIILIGRIPRETRSDVARGSPQDRCTHERRTGYEKE